MHFISAENLLSSFSAQDISKENADLTPDTAENFTIS